MTRADAHSLVAICLAVVVVALAGCDGGEPELKAKLANGYEISLLFTHDGVTVYRFTDGGSYRYFATSGSVSWTDYRRVGKTTHAYPRETQTVELDGGAK